MRLIRKAIALIFLIGLSLPVSAQSPQYTTDQYRSAFAFEQITVAGVSKTFTSSTYNPTCTDCIPSTSHAQLAVMTCDNNSGATIRGRFDGTAPDANTGHIIFAGDVVTIWGFKNISNAKFIRTASTSVVCNVTYYRWSSNQP